MPSINLIWEQRLTRRKYQRLAAAMLAVVGLTGMVVLEELVRTKLNQVRCDAAIAKCNVTIKANEVRANENRKLQAEMAILEPMVDLLQGAQRVTLRWVNLMGELHQSVPDLHQAGFGQCNFVPSTGTAPATTTGSSAVDPKRLIGTLSLSGGARDYAMVSTTMRRLAALRHIGTVRLTQAQMEGGDATSDRKALVRFSLQAQFRIPEDEEKVLLASAEGQAKGSDYSGVLQKAGENTVLNRVPADGAAGKQ